MSCTVYAVSAAIGGLHAHNGHNGIIPIALCTRTCFSSSDDALVCTYSGRNDFHPVVPVVPAVAIGGDA